MQMPIHILFTTATRHIFTHIHLPWPCILQNTPLISITQTELGEKKEKTYVVSTISFAVDHPGKVCEQPGR